MSCVCLKKSPYKVSREEKNLGTDMRTDDILQCRERSGSKIKFLCFFFILVILL